MSSESLGVVSFTKLVVGDLDKSAAFYESVCGLVQHGRVDAEIGGRPISEIMYKRPEAGGGMFVLLAYLDAPNPAAGEIIVGVNTPDADAFVARALAAGGELITAPVATEQFKVKVGFVKDNEGHLIEVVQNL